jgi:hypothetical protein
LLKVPLLQALTAREKREQMISSEDFLA